jgi:hypothetical protein
MVIVASVCVSPRPPRLPSPPPPGAARRSSAARHLAARELVDDDDLAVVADDVLLVLLEERVRLQELMDDVDLLALGRVLGLERLDALPLLVTTDSVDSSISPSSSERSGTSERVGVVPATARRGPVREVHVVPLLVHGEVEHLVDLVSRFSRM